MTLDVDTAPAGATGQLGTPGVSGMWPSPLNFTSRSSTTVRAGMLTERQSLGGEYSLTKPAVNSSSTVCRKAGNVPAWWWPDRAQ